MLKFALITDIHYGRDKGWKLGSQASSLMSSFVNAVNNYKPDFVAALGDHVNSHSPQTDRFHLEKLSSHFNKIAAPVYPLVGNNEIRHIHKKHYEKTLKAPHQSYYQDVKGYRFIFWNPNVNTDTKKGLFLTKGDINWLKNELEKSDKPVILFSHVPLDNTPQDDEKALKHDYGANRSYYPQGPELRKILERSQKVIMCVAGHKHTNRHREINGIHYIVHQSLTQSYDGQKASGSFSFVEIKNNKINIKGFGIKQPDRNLAIPKPGA
jgi:predicted phosphodiesterase